MAESDDVNTFYELPVSTLVEAALLKARIEEIMVAQYYRDYATAKCEED